MLDWLAVALLGIVEGLTEFVPVSSTGHLLIAERWLPRQTDLFNIVIQAGAVLAVLPLFPERIAQVARFSTDARGRDYGLKLLVAFGVTAVGGLALEHGGLRLPETTLPIAVALIVGGVLFLVVERSLMSRPARDTIAWPVAVSVGVSQVVAAAFPGTSRSGAVILVMLAFGTSRVVATEFAFLVGVPTLLAGAALKVIQALAHPDAGGPAED